MPSAYTAREGRVYDAAGNEAATARTTSGLDLEAHDRAVQIARAQRAAIARREQRQMEEAHAFGQHDGAPREGCPECDDKRNRVGP